MECTESYLTMKVLEEETCSERLQEVYQELVLVLNLVYMLVILIL